ncbi:MAG: hypothetical protein OK457_01740 [Thaumarchaeota archaeon]|nr:hypothetical protein [Nitrososphaerota archaeon]
MDSSNGGFESWEAALVADKSSKLELSKARFQAAADALFREGSLDKARVARALFEFSTLMDAFAKIQEGRILKSESDFERSLRKFEQATEILRSTVHYGFLSSYVSACASLETALEMEAGDDSFQGFKNANALFEQSKLLLSFRDEKHVLIHKIDLLLRYSISRALLVESDILSKSGSNEAACKKKQQSKVIEEELEEQPRKKRRVHNFRIDYFPNYDYSRAQNGAFIVVFPELQNLWIGNVGKNGALLEKIGEERVGKKIASCESLIHPIPENFRGKLRVAYDDEENKNQFDEGCLTIV